MTPELLAQKARALGASDEEVRDIAAMTPEYTRGLADGMALAREMISRAEAGQAADA